MTCILGKTSKMGPRIVPNQRSPHFRPTVPFGSLASWTDRAKTAQVWSHLSSNRTKCPIPTFRGYKRTNPICRQVVAVQFVQTILNKDMFHTVRTCFSAPESHESRRYETCLTCTIDTRRWGHRLHQTLGGKSRRAFRASDLV